MFKKTLIVMIIIMLASTAYAFDIQAGAVAMYTTPYTVPEGVPSYENLGLEDFQFGADVRLRWLLFQGAVMALIEAPGEDPLLEPGEIVLVPTAGVNINLVLVDIGLSAGPAFAFNFGSDNISDPTDLGLHLKGTANLNIGPVSPGIILGTNLDLEASELDLAMNTEIYGGFSLLWNF
jgi:hypothetical protein